MTERIALYRPVITEGASGSQIKTYEAAGVYWAQLSSRRDYRTDEVGERFADATAVFLVRSSVEVDEYWQLIHEGKKYEVQTCPLNRRLGMRTLNCQRVNE